MKKYYASRSSLFLIELIIAIFFFIISAAIALQLFATSHFTSKDTVNINHALYYSQNISEFFLGNNGLFSALKDEYSTLSLHLDNPEKDDSIVLLFDKAWKTTQDTSCANYIILIKHSIQNGNIYNNYSCIDIYINKYSNNVFEAISERNYDFLTSDSSYIHNLFIKKYFHE